MEFLMDPSIWVGLLALISLEIVLGIDNMIFIAILADKLPPKKRDRARVVGLSLALIMRLGLLSLISWIVTPTYSLFTMGNFSFSGRELILLLGGIFLLFKATTELHNRLENKEQNIISSRGYASVSVVAMQIVILDAVFSLDAVITAVGMINNLPVMMFAVVIAMTIMLLASRSLTRFVNRHQTVLVLCLSFLLMIGLSLIAEGFGFHIPKGYLYAAIGFSILIELFNQIARRNFIKHQSTKPIRKRTAEAIMRLMGSGEQRKSDESDSTEMFIKQTHFADEERHMINSVILLASRKLRSVMTPRNEIIWLDCQKPVEELRIILMEAPHNMFPVCNGELDQVIGIVRAKDLIVAVDKGEQVRAYAALNPAIMVPETLDVLKLLEKLRRAKGSMVMVSNQFGVILGLVTPLDVLEAIAGEFSDKDDISRVEVYEDSWLSKTSTGLQCVTVSIGTLRRNDIALLGKVALAIRNAIKSRQKDMLMLDE